MVAEESVLIAEYFHIVCIFRKEDRLRTDAKMITAGRQIELRPHNLSHHKESILYLHSNSQKPLYC